MNKGYLRGTHRAIPPALTVERVRPLLREMGITRIANVTGLDVVGIPVVQVTRPNARSNAVSQGKGIDLSAAKASAIMEAIETFHAERILRPMQFASAHDLRSVVRLVDIDRLPKPVDSRFHPDLEMLWLEGEDLVCRMPLWLPYEAVHCRFSIPYPPGSGSFSMTTSGLASGNHRVEAIIHAICELIERDATTLFELASRQQKISRLRLGTINDVDCVSMMDSFRSCGIAVAVWEMTSDIGIPAFCCQLVEHEDGPTLLSRPVRGYGSHPSKSIALMRALTEAAQARVTVISGARDDLAGELYRQPQEGEKQTVLRDHLNRNAEIRDYAEICTFSFSSFCDELDWLLERLRSCGIEEVTVVELTPASSLPYAVVRVVIPGLEADRAAGCVPGPRARARARASFQDTAVP